MLAMRVRDSREGWGGVGWGRGVGGRRGRLPPPTGGIPPGTQAPRRKFSPAVR